MHLIRCSYESAPLSSATSSVASIVSLMVFLPPVGWGSSIPIPPSPLRDQRQALRAFHVGPDPLLAVDAETRIPLPSPEALDDPAVRPVDLAARLDRLLLRPSQPDDDDRARVEPGPLAPPSGGTIRLRLAPLSDRLLHQPEADLHDAPPLGRHCLASLLVHVVAAELHAEPPGREVQERELRLQLAPQALFSHARVQRQGDARPLDVRPAQWSRLQALVLGFPLLHVLDALHAGRAPTEPGQQRGRLVLGVDLDRLFEVDEAERGEEVLRVQRLRLEAPPGLVHQIAELRGHEERIGGQELALSGLHHVEEHLDGVRPHAAPILLTDRGDHQARPGLAAREPPEVHLRLVGVLPVHGFPPSSCVGWDPDKRVWIGGVYHRQGRPAAGATGLPLYCRSILVNCTSETTAPLLIAAVLTAVEHLALGFPSVWAVSTRPPTTYGVFGLLFPVALHLPSTPPAPAPRPPGCGPAARARPHARPRRTCPPARAAAARRRARQRRSPAGRSLRPAPPSDRERARWRGVGLGLPDEGVHLGADDGLHELRPRLLARVRLQPDVALHVVPGEAVALAALREQRPADLLQHLDAGVELRRELAREHPAVAHAGDDRDPDQALGLGVELEQRVALVVALVRLDPELLVLFDLGEIPGQCHGFLL